MISVPAVCANEHLLNLVELAVAPGAVIKRGQKLALLESDKSSFEFESPGDGTVREVRARTGETLRVNTPFIAIETEDEALRHLQVVEPPAKPTRPAAPAKMATVGVWTPRALKLARDAGLDPSVAHGIEATGPGGRISGDDVTRFLASPKD